METTLRRPPRFCILCTLQTVSEGISKILEWKASPAPKPRAKTNLIVHIRYKFILVCAAAVTMAASSWSPSSFFMRGGHLWFFYVISCCIFHLKYDEKFVSVLQEAGVKE